MKPEIVVMMLNDPGGQFCNVGVAVGQQRLCQLSARLVLSIDHIHPIRQRSARDELRPIKKAVGMRQIVH
jgi:hypothetical protein